MPRTPVVLYAAKSTQDKHKSIATQFEDGREKAADEDWEIVGEFQDEGFSAYTGNRGPGLEAARQRAADVAGERGEPCMLVVQAADRFARGAGDRPGAAEALVEIWHAMRRQNVHLRSVEDDFDLRDSASVANLGHRAMMESKRKSGSVRKGLKRRAEKGKPIGSTDPLGLHIGPDGYEPVPSETPIVERIFRDLQAGTPQLRLARNLNREGVPSATGGKWYQGTVRRIARNPVYKGMIVHRGETLQGSHDPVVDPALWDEVNAQLDAQAERYSGRGRGRPSSGRHLFKKGMLRCTCGALMLPRTDRKTTKAGEKRVFEYYVCSERVRDSAACARGPVKRADVDTAVYRYFEQVGLDVAATREQLSAAHRSRLSEAKSLLEQAGEDEQRAEANLTRVRRDYTEDKITAEDWTSFKTELTAGLSAAKAKVARFSAQLKATEEAGALQDAERDVLEMLAEIRRAVAGEINDAQNTEGVRAALTQLFERFELRLPGGDEPVHVDLLQRGSALVIHPVPVPQAVEGYTDSMLPVFRREPLYDADNNYAATLVAA